MNILRFITGEFDCSCNTNVWQSSQAQVAFHRKVDRDTGDYTKSFSWVRTLLAGCETMSIKDSHLTQLASFHNRCARSMCGLTIWHYIVYKASNDNVLWQRLNLLPIDKLLYNRLQQFLHRVAFMDPSRPTFQTLNCQAARLGLPPRVCFKTCIQTQCDKNGNGNVDLKLVVTSTAL